MNLSLTLATANAHVALRDVGIWAVSFTGIVTVEALFSAWWRFDAAIRSERVYALIVNLQGAVWGGSCAAFAAAARDDAESRAGDFPIAFIVNEVDVAEWRAFARERAALGVIRGAFTDAARASVWAHRMAEVLRSDHRWSYRRTQSTAPEARRLCDDAHRPGSHQAFAPHPRLADLRAR